MSILSNAQQHCDIYLLSNNRMNPPPAAKIQKAAGYYLAAYDSILNYCTYTLFYDALQQYVVATSSPLEEAGHRLVQTASNNLVFSSNWKILPACTPLLPAKTDCSRVLLAPHARCPSASLRSWANQEEMKTILLFSVHSANTCHCSGLGASF